MCLSNTHEKVESLGLRLQTMDEERRAFVRTAQENQRALDELRCPRHHQLEPLTLGKGPREAGQKVTLGRCCMHHNSVVRCLQFLPIVKAKMCVFPPLPRRNAKSPAHNLDI